MCKLKTIIIISLLVSILCYLCSCSLGGSRMMFDDSSSKAAKRLEQIIGIINDNDKESLKELFSQKSLDDSDYFDENLDHLFEYIQGEITSWEKSSGPSVSESNNYGHKKREVNSFYFLTTDTQKYFFLITDFPIDDDNPDNVGLYLLLVVKSEDREKIYDGDYKILYDGDNDIIRSGIYIPFE